ncbi:MAG: hypothetical protein L6275_02465 [Candidatus Portnoybacteria bacterium]|nr:hypothetical protein [Candidatus Portnoybacteria bacterium]
MSIFKKNFYFLLFIVFFLSPITLIQGQSSEIEAVLTWSTDTYTHPAYYGKVLPTRESSVEVVANVFFQEVNPQELIYNWFLDDRIQNENSGEGKQIFRFNMGGSSAKKSIKLEIKNQEGATIGQPYYLVIKPQEPEIILKTNSLFNGYFGITPKYQVSSNKKIVFSVQPYFFNIKNIEELNYQWELGEEKAVLTDEKSPDILTLEIGQLVNSFTRNLVVKAENKNNPLQKARLTAEINFKP